ncbi:hypothetical protein PIB30_056942 [Stylosanthes scabra]|uniref:Uncharacterized protein n=1 Tax=Stylosanthes scabra TaxID=79078 RepID=A0ABU6UI95_9FABA|nr:hypothetical protein [Stylosanthes scabra]
MNDITKPLINSLFSTQRIHTIFTEKQTGKKHTQVKSSSLTPAFKGDAGRHSNHLRLQAPVAPPSERTQHYIIQPNTPAHSRDLARKKIPAQAKQGMVASSCFQGTQVMNSSDHFSWSDKPINTEHGWRGEAVIPVEDNVDAGTGDVFHKDAEVGPCGSAAGWVAASWSGRPGGERVLPGASRACGTRNDGVCLR